MNWRYDNLGQVPSGKRFWQDDIPAAGQQFEYAFDDFGNRKTAGQGGDHECIPNSGTDPFPFLLLTWNCKHIHNVAISRQIERICARAGWPCPAICTPFDLLES
jgi:hypothetical protein